MRFSVKVLVLWILLLSLVHATDSINFSAHTLKIGPAQLYNLRFGVVNLQSADQTLSMQAEQLTLPEPFAPVKLVNLACVQLLWQQQLLQCKKGRVEIKAADLNRVVADFSFRFTPDDSRLQLDKVKLAGGVVALKATETKGVWQITLNSKNLSLPKLQALLKQSGIHFKKGTASVAVTLTGQQGSLLDINANIHTRDLSAETQSGLMASENLQLDSYITAQRLKQHWSWQNHTGMAKGGLYIDPIYLAAQSEPIELDSLGTWQPENNLWLIDYTQWLHPKVGNLNGFAKIQPAATPWLQEASFKLTALDLSQFGKTYLNPFLQGTAFEGIGLSGKLQTQFTLNEMRLNALQVNAQQLQLNDPKQRIGIHNANADLQWSRQAGLTKAGRVSWEKLLVYALPLGATKLDLQIAANQIRLTRPVHIDFLGGIFAVQDFSWQTRKAQTPELHFAGALQDVSLDQLTNALKWTPLTGKVSGVIPGVRYKKNRLDLDGAIDIQVFDGKVILDNLAVANLLSDVPKFYGDIAIEKLNLSQLTEKFQFGGIQGLLSGFINDLYLENWKPVSFYAWLGTPENDKTPHRISQKAVDNIAHIGGNGATDLISKGVLGLFDSFGYDELGMGCYLHKGVCQLMGVDAAANGYYLIKGGGLPPRIDVLGYNPKVDWKVLVQRLGRLSSTENMVIE